MDRAFDCPHCASDDLGVVIIEQLPLAVRCRECGATGPRSASDDPAHAIFAWNQRMGRLALVKCPDCNATRQTSPYQVAIEVLGKHGISGNLEVSARAKRTSNAATDPLRSSSFLGSGHRGEAVRAPGIAIRQPLLRANDDDPVRT